MPPIDMRRKRMERIEGVDFSSSALVRARFLTAKGWKRCAHEGDGQGGGGESRAGGERQRRAGRPSGGRTIGSAHPHHRPGHRPPYRPRAHTGLGEGNTAAASGKGIEPCILPTRYRKQSINYDKTLDRRCHESRTCSAILRTGASPSVTTYAPTPSTQPFVLQPPSSSGSDH